jgi:hypothetical protein
MPIIQDEVYQCPDAACGCEVTVTKPALPDCAAPEALICCGKTMVQKTN